MENVKLSNNLEISRLVAGMMNLTSWELSTDDLTKHIELLLGLGIDTFDHADIYGNYSCEEVFGKALKSKPSLREEIKLITKCGIKLRSEKYPSRKVKHYDTSYALIVGSAEQSLRHLHTDRIDLLLIHRPDPFMNHQEVARAFDDLYKQGKVLNFGVSNFNPQQFQNLQACVPFKLVTNQIEISAAHLEHFENDNLGFLQSQEVKPMAWSPIARGNLLNPTNEKTHRINSAIKQIAQELAIEDLSQILYAWLLVHPANIIPVLGTGKTDRIKSAIEALKIELSREDWYRIYEAARGEEVA